MNNKELFAQFAASAPNDIPSWFKHTMTDTPVEPPAFKHVFGTGSNHKYKDLYISFFCDDWCTFEDNGNGFDYRTNEAKVLFESLGLTPFVIPEDLKKEVFHLGIKWDQYYEDRTAWVQENNRQRYFQWRMYYASQMCDFYLESFEDHEVR